MSSPEPASRLLLQGILPRTVGTIGYPRCEMDPVDLGRIPGVLESSLSAAVVRRLPDNAPPAPWDCRLEGVFWAHRPTCDARSVLPGSLGARGRPRLIVGGLVRYVDSPVGEYAEVFAGLVLPGRLLTQHVPFMAVDSLPSLLAGRANWALPKTLGTFSGRSRTGFPLRVDADDWWITAHALSWGPALPSVMRLWTVQVWPDGATRAFRGTIKGRARLARVEIDVDPQSSLASWLLPGRHLAVQWPTARLLVSAPQRP